MCGICGATSREIGDRNKLKSAVSVMNEVQIRRGPDDDGVWSDEKNAVVFGQRRLSIIDLSSTGHQPMSYDSGQFWITFNGEIYNFAELKCELEGRGATFKTKTDTEVILALFKEFGEASFSKMRGIFAFALWDMKRERLFLVRDHYGVKPLYYFSNKEKLVFASTVKAIEKSGEVRSEKCTEALVGFLLMGSVPSPFTTLKNVFSVPAGHYLVREKDGSERLVKYYDSLDAFLTKSTDSVDVAVEKIRAGLKEAVNLNLVSDAPLGVFLSGGLDSSALAALSAKARENPLTTLSITFDEEKFSEKKYQDMVALHIRSNHKEVRIRKEDFYNSYNDIFEAMDQPTIDAVNTFFVSKAAKEAGLKVVLSGLGSDEIFCGYPSFRKVSRLHTIQRLPRALRAPLSFTGLFDDEYAKLQNLQRDDVLSFYLSSRSQFVVNDVAKILGISLPEVLSAFNAIREKSFLDDSRLATLDPVDLHSFLEVRMYMQNQLLKDTDAMSMYHSVEARVPFLDFKLVEYVSGLPSEMKLGGSVNKQLLVDAVRYTLPTAIFNRSKMGFVFPFAEWLKDAPGDFMHDGETTKELFKKFKSGKVHWSRFWASVILSHWKKQ
ncbi:MAG: asparagine synthase (glutamine-hydrolyzing) [bacterium]